MSLADFNRAKYLRWYEALMAKAKSRKIPPDYTEVHHIIPRSFAGSDEPDNLVRLTYREHFIAHWLLTKFSFGRNLRKMQRALFAMTMQANGTRIVAGWQFETAKRAVADLRVTPELIRLRELAEKAKREAKEDYLNGLFAKHRQALLQSDELLKQNPPAEVAPESRKRRRPPGPSKRKREVLRAARLAAQS